MGRTGNRRYRRNRAAILRGEPVCWICGKAIDTTLAWPDPMSASADHVKAHVNGGNDHRDNLKPCHLRCNSSRGKRDNSPTILRRSRSLND